MEALGFGFWVLVPFASPTCSYRFVVLIIWPRFEPHRFALGLVSSDCLANQKLPFARCRARISNATPSGRTFEASGVRQEVIGASLMHHSNFLHQQQKQKLFSTRTPSRLRDLCPKPQSPESKLPLHAYQSSQ